MKKIIYPMLVLIFTASAVLSQGKAENLYQNFSKTAGADAGNTLILGSILVISPSLVIEDGHSHFGLSKELSAGIYPYGRVELDYTFIFRSERKNAIHLSYNLDIPMNGKFNDPSLFFISPGGGYYTDFIRKGYFVQAAFGLFAGTGFSNAVSVHPNVKFRKVFMSDGFPGMFEISLGVGFGFYSR